MLDCVLVYQGPTTPSDRLNLILVDHNYALQMGAGSSKCKYLLACWHNLKWLRYPHGLAAITNSPFLMKNIQLP